jgi:lysosomal Pro-X carboxypeptidase
MLCCNDEMNLVITEARGMGKDFFWPPTHPRTVRTYQDLISNTTFEPCPDPYGIYGYSKEPYEPLSKRLDTYYGGIRMKGHSNIVFSNGLLDPWSAGGVYKNNNNPIFWQESLLGEDKATIQNITESDVIALIIPFGGHHTDLMYRSDLDPKCVTEGRNVEEYFISRWIRDW